MKKLFLRILLVIVVIGIGMWGLWSYHYKFGSQWKDTPSMIARTAFWTDWVYSREHGNGLWLPRYSLDVDDDLQGTIELDNELYAISLQTLEDSDIDSLWHGTWLLRFEKETPVEGWKQVVLKPLDSPEWLLSVWANEVARNIGLLAPNSRFILLDYENKERVFIATEVFTSESLEYHEVHGDSVIRYHDNDKITANSVSADDQSFESIIRAAEEDMLLSDLQQVINTRNILMWDAFLQILRASGFEPDFRWYFEPAMGRWQLFSIGVTQEDINFSDDQMIVDSLIYKVKENPLFYFEGTALLKNFWGSINDRAAKNVGLMNYLISDLERSVYSHTNSFPRVIFDSQTNLYEQVIRSAGEKFSDLLTTSDGAYKIVAPDDEINPWAVDLINQGTNPFQVTFISLPLDYSEVPRLVWDSDGDGEYSESDTELGEFRLIPDENKWVLFSDIVVVGKPVWSNELGHFTLRPGKERLFVLGAVEQQLLDIAFESKGLFTQETVALQPTEMTVDSIPHVSEATITSFMNSNQPFRRDLGNRFVLDAGNHEISRLIVIPPGLQIVIEPGATLSFTKNAGIRSYSPIRAGSVNGRQVLFTGSGWQGLTIYGPLQSSSAFYNVLVEGAGGESEKPGVGLYYAPVEIENSVFRNTTGEAGLHLAHSEAKITNSSFVANAKDGLIYEFGDGLLQLLTVSNNGKNGLLMHSSYPIVYNSIIQANTTGVWAEGLAGPRIYNIQLLDNDTGLYLTDGARPRLEASDVIGNGIGVKAVRGNYAYAPRLSVILNNLFRDNEEDRSLGVDMNVGDLINSVVGYKEERSLPSSL